MKMRVSLIASRRIDIEAYGRTAVTMQRCVGPMWAPSSANRSKKDTPKFANQSMPKKTVMIFELLQMARTRKKNNNEVVDPANIRAAAMLNIKARQ
jgi:hypothetical protein